MGNYKPRHLGGGSVGRTFNGRKEIADDLYRGNREWRDYRARFLAANPKCYRCGKDATVVDHITPHLGDKALFEDLKNHMPLCASCHSTGTNLFDRRFIRGSSTKSKLEWIAWERARLNIRIKIMVLPTYREL
jgi:5-methylcytosine-specific restriction endonuclease McrA